MLMQERKPFRKLASAPGIATTRHARIRSRAYNTVQMSAIENDRAAAVKRTLGAYWARFLEADRSPVSRRELATVAADVAAAAHAANLFPEQLIIAIKEGWRMDCEPRLGDDRLRREWILTELISLSIQEFYRSGRNLTPAEMSSATGGSAEANSRLA